jgi:copper chaperone CopZ
MRSFAIACIVGIFFSNVAIADNALYVLDTPKLSCSYTSSEARHAVQEIDNVHFVASDKQDHTLTVSVETDQTTIKDVVAALTAAGQEVSGYQAAQQN